MTTTVITGANKGLGYETARQLVAAGHTVYLGSRDADRGKQAAADLGARHLLIDITSDESVSAAAATVRAEAGQVDVLINNAGIAGARIAPGDTTGDDLLAVFGTNVFGIVRVMHAFLPLLELSAAPVVVNVSSGLGSLTITNDPDRIEFTINGLAYPASKSAVNMLTVQYAKAYPALRINAVDPGYTATDLNGNSGHQTIEEGAEVIVTMAQLRTDGTDGADGADGPTGGYFDAKGPIPW